MPRAAHRRRIASNWPLQYSARSPGKRAARRPFSSTAYSEPTLTKLAYAFGQATKARREPQLLSSLPSSFQFNSKDPAAEKCGCAVLGARPPAAALLPSGHRVHSL
ncbi:MAG TPA: hypothetical protein VHQ90_23335 [Thermoanaerobaculia bacterium]|nr:hypothetical protein [Thermoanaerobaculia bacterium]